MHDPDMRNPGMRDPGMRNPGMRNPGMHDPGMRDPGMRDPGMRDGGALGALATWVTSAAEVSGISAGQRRFRAELIRNDRCPSLTTVQRRNRTRFR
ncbi:unnamed protein product [[Actinomadura] parvosata subsp. kistnae]|nr:unnamed protein product [Actinomadura parvosata subsp. kistnae]